MLRNKMIWLPTGVTLMMAVAVGTVGAWLWRDTVREYERLLGYELMEEAGADVPQIGGMLLEQFERRATQLVTPAVPTLMEMLQHLDDGHGGLVAFDFQGHLLSDAWSAPELGSLLDATEIDQRRRAAQLNDAHDFTVDNYARYLAGQEATPVRAYFRLYEPMGMVAGYGKVQAVAAARLTALREQALGHLFWNTLIAAGVGLVLLGLVGGICAWGTNRWLMRPARQLAMLMAADTAGEKSTHGTHRAAVSIDAELAAERSRRSTAEEAHDALRSDFDRNVAAARHAAQEAAAQTLQQDRKALLRRAARALQGGEAGAALANWRVWQEKTELVVNALPLDPWLAGLLDALPDTAPIVRHFQADVEVALDPEAFAVALQALLDNALTAVAGRPDGRVSINTHAAETSVEIRIVDNGPGIAERERTHIFAPLWSARADAMGLGLSVAERIVHLHGGTLTLHNEPGKGAAFVIALSR